MFSEVNRKAFEAGDLRRLPDYLSLCFLRNFLHRKLGRKSDLPIPNWVQHAFVDAVHQVDEFHVKSWDEVFGRPLGKGKQLAVARKKLRLRGELPQHIWDRNEGGEPISKDLFESVGKKFGVSGTVAAEIYYQVMKEFKD
jgi:hypothetical protein